MATRQTLTETILEVKKLLEKEGELSIRQISIRLGIQWVTAVKVVELLKELGIVQERESKDERDTRLFRIKK